MLNQVDQYLTRNAFTPIRFIISQSIVKIIKEQKNEFNLNKKRKQPKKENDFHLQNETLRGDFDFCSQKNALYIPNPLFFLKIV